MSRALEKDRVFLDIADKLGRGLGTCDRKRVGAVIVFLGRCVSWGFNGAPPGMPHCEENIHGWYDEAQRAESQAATAFARPLPRSSGAVEQMIQEYAKRQLNDYGCQNVTHAEANALAFAARQGISTAGGTLYVSVSPCVTCAKLLIAADIRRVVFGEAYRDESGINLLRQAGVSVSQLH